MKKLKIAYLSGGNLTHTVTYLNFFRKHGHEVFWITYDRTNKHYDIPMFDISYGAKGNNPSTKWKYFLAAGSIRKVLKKINPDILHGHYVTSAGIICLLSGFTPYVLTVHGTDLISAIKSVFWKNILHYIFKRAAFINPVSDELSRLTRSIGVPQENILVATLGVDTKEYDFMPSLKLHDPIRLLCTRTLDATYDPVTIINAFEILKRSRYKFSLTFASGGPLQVKLQDLVTSKNLDKEIVFLGGYDNINLPNILHNHDIYLSASLWDGTSISLLEAMACGLAPVVSRIKSNQAWLEGKNRDFMFECGNAQELADKIQAIINNEEEREFLIRANRIKVEEKADRDKNLTALEQRYLQIAK
jgi:L-malate glycosyltransferase